MNFLEWLRILLIGVVEGITEWLPVSSTGHMILVDELWSTSVPEIFTDSFYSVFLVVIQLGAILAVVTLFKRRLNPFSKAKAPREKRDTLELWMKVIVGCIPAGVAGLLFDDWMDEHLYNGYVVACMLILYGVFFILLEMRNQNRPFRVKRLSDISYGMALAIGAIQILSLVPGTSRSGVTILGAMLLGCSRFIAAEFTFFLAIPIMLGAGLLKVLKYLLNGGSFSGMPALILFVGMAVAYIVSLFAIRFLMGYIKKKDFRPFGYYRIILGVAVLLFFLFR